MRRRLAIAVLVSAVLLVGAPHAGATTCSGFAAGDVVFEGIALGEPSKVMRFRVARYLKGSGPALVKISTGYTDTRGRVVGMIAGGVNPERGQAWRIVANGSPEDVLETSPCVGPSELLAGAEADEVRAALKGSSPSGPEGGDGEGKIALIASALALLALAAWWIRRSRLARE